MERIAPRNLYCEECSLQFENKLLFDLHISLKHRKRIQGAKVPEIYKEKSPKPQTKKNPFQIMSFQENPTTLKL